MVDGVFLKYAISQETEICANRIINVGNHPTARVFFALSYNSPSNSKQKCFPVFFNNHYFYK